MSGKWSCFFFILMIVTARSRALRERRGCRPGPGDCSLLWGGRWRGGREDTGISGAGGNRADVLCWLHQVDLVRFPEQQPDLRGVGGKGYCTCRPASLLSWALLVTRSSPSLSNVPVGLIICRVLIPWGSNVPSPWGRGADHKDGWPQRWVSELVLQNQLFWA